jgi:hypothetical protein
MTDVHGLIAKHRTRGLLVDTNLLLLYLVGLTNRHRIPKFKRTEAYTIDDFELLDRFITEFPLLLTIPHILTEVSNLGDLQGRERDMFRSLFTQIAAQAQEFYDESRLVVLNKSFVRHGLTDAAIVSLERHAVLVLTSDFDLYCTLIDRGVDAINFNHLRPANWQT